MNSFLFTEVDLRWARFPGRIPVAAVACGHQHTLFLTAAGTVHSCGLGEYGRLGHGDERSLSRPTLIESLVGERVTQIAAGPGHSVAVSWEGKAFTWGWGFMGSLGHGSEADCLNPTRVSLPHDVGPRDTPGAAGTLRSTRSTEGAEDSAGGVAGCGRGFMGTLGHSNEADCLNPTRVSNPCNLGPRDTLKPNYLLRDALLTPGAEVPAGDVAGCVQIDRVTCATASTYRTVLGMNSGRVLMTIPLEFSTSTSNSGSFLEIGRLPDGLQCWRVGIDRYWYDLFFTVFVIDSAGHVHIIREDGMYTRPPFVSTQADEGCEGCGGGTGIGSGAKVGVGHQVKCSDVFLSPCDNTRTANHVSFIPDGMHGLGSAISVVVISSDGSLLTATANVRGVHELRRRMSDGVFCAAVFFVESKPYGLLMVDGGASLLTWGTAHSGQLGHGHSQIVVAPTAVTSAFVLGSTSWKRDGTRSSNVRVSLSDDGRSIRPSVASGGGGDAADKPPRREAFLLALVDAAADERDALEEPLAV
ncbi:unnamed protein product [Laminaria digitata]